MTTPRSAIVSASLLAALAGCAHHTTRPDSTTTSPGMITAAPTNAPRRAATKAQTLAAWERLKGLQGSWKGRSTKGWTEAVEYKLIAAGTCLVESSFDAHPNETMLTIWHLDGDRLLLTHYCVAKNQPRLVLTRVDDDARELVFEFLDATNLPSRDTGHMDKLVMTFGEGTFTDQWTWYQKGKEQWMEQIEHERATP